VVVLVAVHAVEDPVAQAVAVAVAVATRRRTGGPVAAWRWIWRSGVDLAVAVAVLGWTRGRPKITYRPRNRSQALVSLRRGRFAPQLVVEIPLDRFAQAALEGVRGRPSNSRWILEASIA